MRLTVKLLQLGRYISPTTLINRNWKQVLSTTECFNSIRTRTISDTSRLPVDGNNKDKSRLVLQVQKKYRKSSGSEQEKDDTYVFLSLFTLLISYFAWKTWNGHKRRSREWFVVEAAKPLSEDLGYADLGSNRDSTYKGGHSSAGHGDNNKTPPKSRRKTNNEVADVVEMVGNAVVCIEVKDHSTLDWMSGTPRVVSNGSGFIIKDDGLILTNAHVVTGRQRSSLTIRLNDGRRFAGRVVDFDTQSDLATVQIQARGLPVMPLGSSSDLRIGEKVVAIGSPLSLSNTVTSGVVSCVSRKADELGIGTNINYIQTDAAITFGNSGGPLVNLDGEAIGINSMKVTSGISFAIPIDYAKGFLAKAEASAKGGRPKTRRYIGLTLLTLTEEILGELPNVPINTKGVLVWKVVVGSPSYMAGLQPGDVITKVNNEAVTTAADFYNHLQRDAVLTIQFRRGSKSYRCQLVPEDVDEE